ncbi:hypothetical protein JCM14469_26680 [Desulfatiferula olefinivorans]
MKKICLLTIILILLTVSNALCARVEAQLVDLGNNGTTDQRTVVYFDDQGRIYRQDFDENVDGTPESYRADTYLSGVRISTSRRFEYGTDTLLSGGAWTYDGSGRLLTQTIDTTGDGQPEHTYTYVYGDGGSYTMTETSGSGVILQVKTVTAVQQ